MKKEDFQAPLRYASQGKQMATHMRYQALTPPERTPGERLYWAVVEHFDADPRENHEAHVLHHDYRWTVRQIAEKRFESHPSEDLEFVEETVVFDLEDERGRHRFDEGITAERVLKFFQFMALEVGHRDEALLQVATVRPLISDTLLEEVGVALEWNFHQKLEYRLIIEGKN